MTSQRVWYVICDHCGYTTDDLTGAGSAGQARRQLKEQGWTRPRAHPDTVMRIDWCPTCSREA
jgi:hypothetical protein